MHLSQADGPGALAAIREYQSYFNEQQSRSSRPLKLRRGIQNARETRSMVDGNRLASKRSNNRNSYKLNKFEYMRDRTPARHESLQNAAILQEYFSKCLEDKESNSTVVNFSRYSTPLRA